MATVSNSSPLIALTQIGRLELLRMLFSVIVVPPAVRTETARTLHPFPAWVEVQALRQPLHPRTLSAALGLGEKEAITLALETRSSRLILDDQPAARLARRLGVPTVGTLGILLAAKRLGCVAEVRPHLEALLRVGFFMSPELYNAVLANAGEK